MSERTDLVLKALEGGPLDIPEIVERTGIARPGSILHYLALDKRVRRVGERPVPGLRPTVIWELGDG